MKLAPEPQSDSLEGEEVSIWGGENLLPSAIFSGWFLSVAQRGQFENTLCGKFSEIMANISIETRIW